MVGGSARDEEPCQSFFSCSLPDLWDTCEARKRLKQGWSDWMWGKPEKMTDPVVPSCRAWENLGDLPVYYSTCATVRGELIAVGGQSEDGKASSAVYKYDPSAQSWSEISSMATARFLCYVAVVGDKLIVVGGIGDYNKELNSIEVLEL